MDPSAYLPGVNVLMPFSQIFGAQRAMSHSVSVDHDRSIDASIPLSTRLELNRKLKLLSPEGKLIVFYFYSFIFQKKVYKKDLLLKRSNWNSTDQLFKNEGAFKAENGPAWQSKDGHTRAQW